MPSGSAAAGAGLRMVVTPAARASDSPRIAASIGCSSWVRKTPAREMRSAWASRSAGAIAPATPGQTMIALSPVASSMKM